MDSGKTLEIANEILLPKVAQMIAQGNDVVLRTKGNSMLPFITGERDSVVLSLPGHLHVGDIVLAEIAPKRFVLHRIYAISGDEIELMGDGNLRAREHCPSDNVLGVVKEILRRDKVHIDCSAWFRRFLAWLWRHPLFPFRRIILGIRRRIVAVFC